MVRDIGLVNIFKGVLPFLAADMVRLSIIVAVPWISLVLPRTMGWTG
jgi:TRAP-type C4-dicarboxylate transport system permease large subunit